MPKKEFVPFMYKDSVARTRALLSKNTRFPALTKENERHPSRITLLPVLSGQIVGGVREVRATVYPYLKASTGLLVLNSKSKSPPHARRVKRTFRPCYGSQKTEQYI